MAWIIKGTFDKIDKYYSTSGFTTNSDDAKPFKTKVLAETAISNLLYRYVWYNSAKLRAVKYTL